MSHEGKNIGVDGGSSKFVSSRSTELSEQRDGVGASVTDDPCHGRRVPCDEAREDDEDEDDEGPDVGMFLLRGY